MVALLARDLSVKVLMRCAMTRYDTARLQTRTAQLQEDESIRCTASWRPSVCPPARERRDKAPRRWVVEAMRATDSLACDPSGTAGLIRRTRLTAQLGISVA